MKNIMTVALMLNLGVASVYAQQKPVKMTFSGSNVATMINLQANTVTDETHLDGNGTWAHSHSVSCTLTERLPSLPAVALALISQLLPERAYFAFKTEACWSSRLRLDRVV
jgi:hypothetical protein